MRTRIWNYENNQSCDPEKAGEHNAESLRLLWEAMRKGAVDLHVHSNVSDGKTSPPQLVQEVLRNELKAFSLTDHDTIAGIEAVSMVYEKLSQLGVALPDFIPGVEISAGFEGQEVHLLAYYPAGMIRCLDAYLEERRKDREDRNRRLCEKAETLGMHISYEELSSEGGFVVGRLHMAQLMIRKGYVASVSEAFERFLGDGRPCYVKRNLPRVEDAIKKVRETGGVPVLAHPALYRNWLRGPEVMSREELGGKIAGLKEAGLQGIEVLHGETGREESFIIAGLTAELGLLPTVGSDYHGSHKPRVHMQNAKNDFRPFLAGFFPEFSNKAE